MTTGLAFASERVVLLHGLARSSKAMNKLEATLEGKGYVVSNMDYPSTSFTVQELSSMVKTEIDKFQADGEVIHFVTHSMGGIIVRYIQQTDPIKNLGRVVMLSPPNQGSEVVDVLGARKLFKLFLGTAGQQLGTNSDGIVHSLGDADFELGIITGDRSMNPILSLMINGKDDGKVSIARAKLNGMKSFKVVHASHTFIMKHDLVGENVISFLEKGVFE